MVMVVVVVRVCVRVCMCVCARDISLAEARTTLPLKSENFTTEPSAPASVMS